MSRRPAIAGNRCNLTKYVNGKKSNNFGDFLDARVTAKQNKNKKLRTQREAEKKINLL